ncbi:hypothetical protein [Pseudarthrobacter raffinosi]|uniref:hypothetical protein n=1 Tax=Pseudarthrobacter raffinosi TaxID=2953651 RepID=UPI0035AB72FA
MGALKGPYGAIDGKSGHPGTPHNEARDEVWEELLTIMEDKHDGGDLPEGVLRRALARNAELVEAFSRAWPPLNYSALVGDLWRVPAYLRLCAPWLSPDEVQKLQRQDPHAWTTSDLPLLDAARQRLERVGLTNVNLASLSINYRTPEEVMAEAEPVIRAVVPDANVPTSIRSSGLPVVHGSTLQLGSILDTWLAEHDDGTACVISTTDAGHGPFLATSRARWLSPELVKGLEFDLVVLVDPEGFGPGIEGAVDRYVAMTRATRQLVILTSP